MNSGPSFAGVQKMAVTYKKVNFQILELHSVNIIVI